MHLLMIGLALVIAIGLRLLTPQLLATYPKSWNKTLFLFVFPPLLLLSTIFAILCMGSGGEMLGMSSGQFSYGLAIILGIWGGICLLIQLHQVKQTFTAIDRYPQRQLEGLTVRWLNLDFPYCAQVGFLRSQIILTQGLVNILSPAQLTAVLAHEQAHAHYRDTFWFIWLNCLRSMTRGLPHSELLWQKLLLLREMRADRQAALTIDPLLLAESLLIIAQTVHRSTPFDFTMAAVPFHEIAQDRLCDRIDALLSSDTNKNEGWLWTVIFLLFTLIPLITIPLHS